MKLKNKDEEILYIFCLARYPEELTKEELYDVKTAIKNIINENHNLKLQIIAMSRGNEKSIELSHNSHAETVIM